LCSFEQQDFDDGGTSLEKMSLGSKKSGEQFSSFPNQVYLFRVATSAENVPNLSYVWKSLESLEYVGK